VSRPLGGLLRNITMVHAVTALAGQRGVQSQRQREFTDCTDEAYASEARWRRNYPLHLPVREFAHSYIKLQVGQCCHVK
jgi:hypothetical protein